MKILFEKLHYLILCVGQSEEPPKLCKIMAVTTTIYRNVTDCEKKSLDKDTDSRGDFS
jgi:hypothetical protein